MKNEKLSSITTLGVKFNSTDKIWKILIGGLESFGNNFSNFPYSFVDVLIDSDIAFFLFIEKEIVIFIKAKTLESLELLLNNRICVLLTKDNISDKLHNLEHFPLFPDLLEHAWTQTHQSLENLFVVLNNRCLKKLDYVWFYQFFLFVVLCCEFFLVQQFHQIVTLLTNLRNFACEKFTNLLQTVANMKVVIWKQIL